MRVLVTGGAGFIGSAVIRYIIDHTTDSVVNMDKLTYASNLESLGHVRESPRYSFEQVDVCERAAVDDVLARHQPDAVMHLAAQSHVDRSIDAPSAFIQTNLIGTFTLLEASRAYWYKLTGDKKRDFRFHQISTDEVYGDLGKGGGLFTEESRYAPSNPYGASKAGADHLVRAWQRTYGLPTLVTNCSNNYGPRQFPEKLIPLMILNALDGKHLPVYGTGDQVRDWLYVEDHARALHLVLKRGQVGQTYNIGGHCEKRNIEVVHTLCALLDELRPRMDKRSYAEQIAHVPDRRGHDLRYAVDASRMHSELGWQPAETFETGMRKTVAWYLANPGWCRRMLDGTRLRERRGLAA